MNKKTKLAILISAAAAVVSAVILIIVFWDRLLEKLPCRKCEWDDEFLDDDDDVLEFTEAELNDFADLDAK